MTSLLEENAELRERLAQLYKAFVGNRILPLEWKLTPSEAIIMRIILRHPIATREMLMQGLLARTTHAQEEEPQMKTLDVHVMNLRKKLKSFGIGIMTRATVGYYLDAATRERLRHEET
jgi:DNA-binding response OmpR family regulator